MSSEHTREEQHGMKGWGRILGADLDSPRSREDAMLTAMMSTNDQLYEIKHIFLDIQARLTRIETYLEEAVPGYAQSSAYQQNPPASRNDFLKRIPVSVGELGHG